jgi:hypothetical protein
MSETRYAEASKARQDAASLDKVLAHLEAALGLLDDLAGKPELGAHLDLLIHRTREEIALQAA